MKKSAVLLIVLLVLCALPVCAEEGPTPYDDPCLVGVLDKKHPGSNGVSIFFSEELLAKMHDLHLRVSETRETNSGRGWVELIPRLKDSVEVRAKFYSLATGGDRQGPEAAPVYRSSQKLRKSETARARFSSPRSFNYVIFY